MQVITEELLVPFGDTFGTVVTRVWKPDQSRASVFCIHGFTGNGADFDYLAEFLMRNQYTVVCPDMIGRGKSTYFGDPKMYTPETYFACIHALARYAGKTNCFLGTSWGAFIVLVYLYMARVKADRLILNDVCLRNTAALDKLRNDVLQDSRAEFGSIEEARAYIRKTRGFLGNLPPEQWQAYADNKIRKDGDKYRLAYDPATTGNFYATMGREYDFFPLLPRLATPILLLFGAASPFYEDESIRQLTNHYPFISCAPELAAGHPPSLMTQDQALMVLGFLSTQAPVGIPGGAEAPR